MRILYFAYGSNMLSSRIHSRVTSVELIGPAFLKDVRMLFNKRSKDRSGKANLVESPGNVTWGVLYEIDVQGLDTLDKVEGGYNRLNVQVWKTDGNVVKAVTYISANLTDDTRAYEWYTEIILSGAKESKLPKDYIAYLERLPSKSKEEV